MRRMLAAIILSLLLQFSANTAHAADCTIVYGGGEIACPSPTPSQTSPQTTPAKPNQTKGGLPVHNQTNTTKTPATGPETLGLISLIPLAAAGFWLRKRG